MWKAYSNLRGAGSMRRVLKKIVTALVIILVLYFLLYILQNFWAHRQGKFVPDYQHVTLSENSDYEIFFLQTGLGQSAVDKLLRNDDFKTILEVQNSFWKSEEIVCKPVFGLFSRVDKISTKSTPLLVDLQPGDILVTLSTHSAGWHHGHAGLVLDENSVLECVKWGQESEVVKVGHWKKYSNYVVLRVKGVSKEQQQKVVAYAKEHLCGVPYRLTAGMFGEKSPDVNGKTFGTHCGHSVWYVWNQFGYDLDSDGGRLVTPYDLLRSKHLEVVQVYGIDPREFLTKFKDVVQ